MKLDEFVKKYEEKHVEVAGSVNAQNQCTDLANRYFIDVWGLPIIEWTNAVDFPERIKSPLYFVENTTDYIPEPGEVVVFKKYGSLYGTPGHIGVIVTATQKEMQIFEQNYPTGNKCKINKHNYLGCRGFIKNKQEVSMPSEDGALQECLKLHGQLVDENVKLKQEIETIKSNAEKSKEDFDNKLKDTNQLLKEKNKEFDKLNSELLAYKEKVAERLAVPIDKVFTELDRLISVESDGKKAMELLRQKELIHTKEKLEMEGTITKLEQQLSSGFDQYDYKMLLIALLKKLRRDLSRK